MIEVIGVNFKPSGKVYYFDPNKIQIETGNHIIVETARGLEYGYCTMKNTMMEDNQIIQPLRKVIRIATKQDELSVENNLKKEQEYTAICQEKADKHHLEMKVINCEIAFDQSRILFYFTADGRIDFRELVRDLASIFHTRIELRQIGVRDEAKLLGALGICGRPCCCNSFLEDFAPVSIKMAKEQNLSLNPTKISGTCGRLMCCLKYEQEAYEDLHKNSPKIGDSVTTIDGNGTVQDIVNILTGTLKIKLGDEQETIKTYKKGEYARPGEELSPIKPELESINDVKLSSYFSEPDLPPVPVEIPAVSTVVTSFKTATVKTANVTDPEPETPSKPAPIKKRHRRASHKPVKAAVEKDTAENLPEMNVSEKPVVKKRPSRRKYFKKKKSNSPKGNLPKGGYTHS